MRTVGISACALCSCSVLLAGPVRAVDPVPALSRTLRAAYIVTNMVQARLDPATGSVSGVIADVARAEFSASSRLFGLNGEARMTKRSHNNAIIRSI
jgi:hypothetical protein